MKRSTMTELLAAYEARLQEQEQRMLGRLEERDRVLIKRLENYEQALRARERELEEREARFERTLGHAATQFTSTVLKALDEVGTGSSFRAEIAAYVREEIAQQVKEQHNGK